MNFLRAGQSADYVLTDGWSEKALEEAQRVGTPKVACTTRQPDGRYVRVPVQAEVKFDPKAAYVHTTSNNTLMGTQFHTFLDTGAVPHVCDMSSDFLWRKFDVSKFSLTYAGAQKNIGPSGLVVAIARKDWIASAREDIPKILRYQTHAEANSLYNTPNTWGIYLARNVLSWLKTLGGLEKIEQRNKAKAAALYAALDAGYYKAPVERASRSVMNIVFRLPSEALEEKFIGAAKKAGMVGLKGHRSTGGIRVSAYNAVSESDIATLVSFMKSFAQANG
jgi:phosphoserine aminotransferase